ncbi:MAG: NAD-dependent DNA ligase LigA [Chlamydiales bacterium]|nr:NAD-dependent DNA ligase LigA [Chlamydiales bacterium]
MNKEDYFKLIEEIREHDIHYYIEARPIISDYEYDQLYKKIEQTEKEHPDWIISDSPTQNIKDSLHKGFVQVKHHTPMMSLTNTYSQEELVDFMHRVEKLLEKKEVIYCVELKMDGLAISLHNEDGFFIRGVTRGDGEYGDDVTNNLRTIKNLPLKLKGKVPGFIEIRAEVFMPLEVFHELNTEKEEAGEQIYANPRNAAAGSLKLLDSKEVFARRLSIYAYGIEGVKTIHSQYDVHHILKTWGLPSFSQHHYAQVSSIDELMDFADKIEKERNHLPFEIDGIVVKLDSIGDRESLGTTAKSPRWAVAYKFAPQQAKTVIKEITVQVGRTGVLTPVAELEPVFVSGSMIARATLHNLEEIHRKDIRVHDTVVIEKGGDVIPKVVSVDPSKRSAHTKPWHMPVHCPMCNASVEHHEGEVAYRCPNHTGCPGQNIQRIIFFTSKKAMNIENLGSRLVERFVRIGLIKSISDIYRITASDLEPLEGFKEKSITNLLKSIEESKQCALHRFILALGIKNVGEETALLLASHFETLENIKKATIENLEEIEGVGPVVAASICQFFQHENQLKEIQDLLDLGVSPISPKKRKQSHHSFADKTFVLTGTLEKYSRSEAGELIQERGGKVSSSISSNTDFLLVGKDPGSKLDKAKKLHVTIMDEEEFLKHL